MSCSACRKARDWATWPFCPDGETPAGARGGRLAGADMTEGRAGGGMAEPRRKGRTWPFISGALAGIVVAAGVLLAVPTGLRLAVAPDALTTEQAAALKAKTEQSQAQIQALRAQLVTADAELAVERAARRAQEANLAALQAQAGQLRDRLAFYDQLLPAGPAGTISIRAVEATRVSAGLRYRVLLMRSARPGLAPFTGALQFVAEGTLDGAEVRIALMPLQAAPAQEVASGNLVPADTVPANPDSFGKPVRRVASDPAASGPAASDPAASAPAASNSAAAVATSPTSASLVPLEVDQYRSTEGILALPDGFVPAIVSVDVLRDGVVLASQQTAVAF